VPAGNGNTWKSCANQLPFVRAGDRAVETRMLQLDSTECTNTSQARHMATTTDASLSLGDRGTARFGELLRFKGLLSRKDLAKALKEQRRGGGRLGQVLVRLSLLSDDQITDVLAEQFSIERIHLNANDINLSVARLVPEAMAKRFVLVAVGESAGKIVVAMADPLDVVAIDTVTLRLRREVKLVVSSRSEILRAIEIVYHGSDLDEQRLRDLVQLEVGSDGTQADLPIENVSMADISVEEAAAQAPVIRFVDLLLRQAVKSRASDIHVEPQEYSMTVRMRIDGALTNMVPPPRSMEAAVCTRIKILSKMDIAERRLPQDGRFKVKAPSRDIDVRVSTIPTIYGEKVVMRILDPSSVSHDLKQLGFEPELLEQFKEMLLRPHGIIVVTGPTGSGKSTTLYSALKYLRDPSKNITTVEDPVEYRIDGINQIQVKPEIGLDFAISLRAILRQDPDIIFIGEIRDKETIDIAIKASLTGHLVLSTFHTNDAPSAISRMRYMDVQSYLLASTLNLIIAQRLVRRLCDHCKERMELNDRVLKCLNINSEVARDQSIYRGRGCKNCSGSGYVGRLPIFEFLAVDNEIREMLVSRASEAQIRAAARRKGYGGLLESGVSRVLDGLTTAEEILSVATVEETSPGRTKEILSA
jgi:type IV pilus assembly protein PilB